MPGQGTLIVKTKLNPEDSVLPASGCRWIQVRERNSAGDVVTVPGASGACCVIEGCTGLDLRCAEAGVPTPKPRVKTVRTAKLLAKLLTTPTLIKSKESRPIGTSPIFESP
jgi:hypothetical protein